MKITFRKDRIRLQSENARESKAILAISDLVFLNSVLTGNNESIANDHGCIIQNDLTAFNYCSVPFVKKIGRGKRT